MGFNYAKERMKFEKRWNKLRKEYRDAGMSESNIQKMYDFDNSIFRQQRRFETHNQGLPLADLNDDDPEAKTDMFKKYESLTVTFDESDFGGSLSWIETIDIPKLAARLKQLKHSDLELLTMIAIEGFSQVEVADKLGCSQKNISIKIKRLKKFLK